MAQYLLFCIALSFSWSLRGQFGHWQGALIPGAIMAMMIPLFIRRYTWKQVFGLSLIMGAVGFSLGGHLSYGKVIENILATPSLRDTKDGFIRIFTVGALWGGLGCTFLGLALSEKKLRLNDWILISILCLDWLLVLGFLNQETLDIPLYFLGFLILQYHNFMVRKSRTVAVLGFTGFLTFGAAFSLAVLLLYWGNHGILPGRAWWTLRDQFIGFFAGIFLWPEISRLALSGHDPANGGEMAKGKALRAIVVVFSGLLLIAAILKENALRHWHYWEPGYTLMVAYWCILAFSLYYLKAVRSAKFRS